MIGLLGSNALVIAAHPDDEVLGCGGFIAANRAAGGATTVLVVSEGSGAQAGYEVESKRARRGAQLRRAAEVLGAQRVEHWDYPDMRLDEVPHLELNAALQRFIAEGGYEIILCHHLGDVNRDHRVVYESALVACRPTPQCAVRALLTYYISSSTEWGFGLSGARFAANVYLDITDQLDRKLEALSVYEEEMRPNPHPRSLAAVRTRAAAFGSEVGCNAAEAFHLVYCRESATR